MIDWSAEKDAQLRRERGICFQDIVLQIEQGNVLAVSDHPNQAKYPGQSIYYVKAGNYVYLVPFVRNAKGIFLKTIIPSRKATKHFLNK